MCAIVGAIVSGLTRNSVMRANSILNFIVSASHERGRDGRGYVVNDGVGPRITKDLARGGATDWSPVPLFLPRKDAQSFICNLRAEPTTEYVERKTWNDQQPYYWNEWAIVHNGTIANDKELRTGRVQTAIDSAAIVEHLGAQIGRAHV